MYEALGDGDQDERRFRGGRQKVARITPLILPRGRTTPTTWSASPTCFSGKGYFDRVGKLLDEAMPKIPHRAEPIEMSINLAQKTKDPARMADAVERLLSLGWPGQDEYFRIEAGNQVDQMVKQLRADNKAAEADAAREEARRIDVARRVRAADAGTASPITTCRSRSHSASRRNTRCRAPSFGGALIKNGYGLHPEEIYVCPRGFNGKYTIRVSKIWY